MLPSDEGVYKFCVIALVFATTKEMFFACDIRHRGRSYMTKRSNKWLVMVALLTAIHIILSRFCSINAWNLKIGFAFVPVFVAAYLYGPFAAALVGGLGDFLGAILFPIGPYFPGFTLTCILSGLVFGILLHKKQATLRILGAVAINQLVLGLLVNTLWISILYDSSYMALLLMRVVQCTILVPVEFFVIGALTKTLFRRRKEVFV